MMAVCSVLYLVLTLAATVIQAISYRNKNDVSGTGLWISIAAGIVFTIGLVQLFGNDSSTGMFTYYVNGAPMGAGYLNVELIVMSLIMSPLVSYGVSVGFGYLLGHRRDPSKKGKPRVFVLVLSIIAAISGVQSLFFGLLSYKNISEYATAVMGGGIIMLGLGIWGILDYHNKKKKLAQINSTK